MSKQMIRMEVTTRDIALARRFDRNPLEFAAMSNGYYKGISPRDLPQFMVAWLRSFEAGEAVEPINFEMEVET